jgi:transcriptional regulator with XRE-family HTH domain
VSSRVPSFEQRAHRRAFGEAVNKLRTERGWTQEDLAERADLDRSYLSGIESGQSNPTLDVIVKIAQGLQVTVADLFV